jgi:hypothetical protein
MCQVWDIQKFREQGENARYPIVGDYVNDLGQQAITYRDAWGELVNIYAENGKDAEYIEFYADSKEDQPRVAAERMAKRGFKPVVQATESAPVDATEERELTATGR